MSAGDEHATGIEKPFVEHLEDLRKALIGSAASLGVGFAVAIPLAPYILSWLKRPVAAAGLDPDAFLRVIRVGDGFSVAMRIMFWGGLLIGCPGVLVALARFVFPGLTEKERRLVSRLMMASALLFVVGVAIGYFTSVGVAIVWLLQVNAWLGIRYDFVELADYCEFVLKLLLSFGLVFELPIVVVALGSMGLIHSRAMREKRRHVIVGLMAVAMVMTPPDPMTMLLMSIPLILLYECCIWIVWARERAAGVVPPPSA